MSPDYPFSDTNHSELSTQPARRGTGRSKVKVGQARDSNGQPFHSICDPIVNLVRSTPHDFRRFELMNFRRAVASH